MKKNLLCLFVLLCSVALFTACGDDDPQPIQDGEFDGVYLGTLDVDAGELGKVNDIPQKIYISKTGESQIKMQLKKFTYPGIGELGDIELDGIKAVRDGNGCTFAGTGSVTLLPGKCDLDVSGAINDGKLSMNIKVKVAVFDIDVNFGGTKIAVDKSSEANILTFGFENELVIGEPTINGTSITFVVSDNITDEQLSELAPIFTISKGATVDKQSGVKQDFTQPVVYTVTSEDGIVKNQYTVYVAGKEMSFDEWKIVESSTSSSSESYETPVGQFGTSNPGVMTINELAPQVGASTFEYPVKSVDGKVGKAAQIKTIHSFISISGVDYNAILKEGGLGDIPYVTSGSLFTGSFKTDIKNPLNSTKFGVPFVGEPVTLSGWYKYTPGSVYYNTDNTVDNKKVDECSIYAVLYEELLDGNGNNIVLTGDYKNPDVYIGTSPRIIMRAALENGGTKEDWTEFTVPFKLLDKKKYDSSKKYYLAVVCASSAEGDYYKGAPGSTLTVDNLKIISK